MPQLDVRPCALWAVGGSLWRVNYMRGWSSPLLSHSRSLDPAFDLRPSQYSSSTRVERHSVSEDNYSPDRYTHTLQLTLVYSRCMHMCGMHEQMLMSTSGGWGVDTEWSVWARVHICTALFALKSLEADVFASALVSLVCQRLNNDFLLRYSCVIPYTLIVLS